jgi:ferredoxin
MRVRVDRQRCQGHARCWVEAPSLYLLDDDGYSAITEVTVEPDMESAALRGARGCPEHAIEIVTDP